MRFTFLLPSDNLTGGARVVSVYARELIALGHEVLVLTCAEDVLPWRQRFRQYFAALRGANEVKAAVRGHIALSGVPHRVMARHGPITVNDVPDADVLVATWWETAVWMHTMPARKGRKVHLIQGYEIWFGQHMVQQVHAALKLPNIKVAISRDLKVTIEAALGPLGIAVIPNAVDPSQFNAPVRARNSVPTVGFVYSVASIKGADICAKACELARLCLPNLRVISFGTDAPDVTVPLPLGTSYYRRPSQDHLRDHYAACDAWLFGSRLDSFGLPILEAMACRTPVIAVPIGAAEDLVGGGGGVLVAKESPQEMADALVRMCTQPEPVWLRQSSLAYETAHHYSWTDATRRLLAIVSV